MTTVRRSTSEEITIQIDGPRITAEKFRKGINAFLDLIDAVVADVSGSKHNIRWIVSVSSGSASIHLRPEPASPRLPSHEIPSILDTIQTGVEMIENTSQRPPHFSDTALRNARDLAKILGGDQDGLDSIYIRLHGKRSSVTTRTLANVDSIFQTSSRDWGSIEGRLSEVSERGERPHVYVYDRLLDKHIRCHVTQDVLEEMAPHWGKRVNVTGFIRYYRGGEIKDIDVEEFEIFPDPHTLPGFDDVYGLLKDAD